MTPISVGLIAYNEEENIKNLVLRILGQELLEFEINEVIVVSSGCTDKTNDIVREISSNNNKVKLLVEEDRRGKYYAINLFLKHAKSEIIVLESADTLPNIDAIEKICRPLLDARVGIVASRPKPMNKINNFINYFSYVQWEILHFISSDTAKFGELIAFKKVITKISPTAVDEEEIARLITRKGFKGVYVPSAIVFNNGPRNLSDIISQRRRIFAGHLSLSHDKNFKVSTMSSFKILKNLFKIEKKRYLWLFLVIFLEGYSRFLGWSDFFIFKRKHFVWKISKSTKSSLSRKDYCDTTIIIPTLNEAKNISKLLEMLLKEYDGIKIIVSDDNSKDGTQEIVNNISSRNEFVRLLERVDEPLGLTSSVIRAVRAVDTDNIVVMDGDLQHPPEKVREIVDALDNYDLAIGRRRSVRNWRIDRRLMSLAATFAARLRLVTKKSRCRDVMSGFFGIKTELFKRSIRRGVYELEGYKVLFDFLKSNKKKLSVKEVEYDFGMRGAGASKAGFKHAKVFFKSLFK